MVKRFFSLFLVCGLVCACFGGVAVLGASEELGSAGSSANAGGAGEAANAGGAGEAANAGIAGGATNSQEVYIKDYEEYENLMGEFDQNSANKVEYIKQLYAELQELEANKDVRLYKAEVIEISEPEVQYLQDTATAEYAMGLYQNGKVRIVEEGAVYGLELGYMACLSYDVYNNIVMPRLEVGDVTYVTMLQMDEESFVAISPELDTYVERFPTMAVVSAIIIVGLMIYFGRNCLKFVVPLVLMVDILFFVVGPLILEGFNLWLLLAFTILLNTIAISVLKLGVNSKAFTATFSTVLVCMTMVLVHFGIDAILNFSGLTSQTFLLSSGVTPSIVANEVVQRFDFHSLSVALTMILMFGLVALTACKVVSKCEEHKAKSKMEELVRADLSEYIAEMSFIAVVILITQMLPSYLILLAKNYTMEFVLQSEMFLVEFVRLFVVLIGAMLTVPFTLIINKFMED